jgi:hypothetical protein
MKLKPWRGKLRQNTHQFTWVLSLTEPRAIGALTKMLFTPIRRASSLVSSFAVDRRPWLILE